MGGTSQLMPESLSSKESGQTLARSSTIRKALRWARRNLFATPWDALMTLGVATLLVWAVPAFLRWAVLEADLTGSTRESCTSGGACWVFVRTRIMQFFYGFYPETGYWRVNVCGLMLLAGASVVLLGRGLMRRITLAAMFTVYPVIAFILLLGGAFGLEAVETSKFGGLMLTILIAAVGIAGSLPIGVLLALGRRSEMPVVRSLCVIFIELWRGVPLITVLFMASVMLPLFLPAGMTFDKLLRALLGVMFFSSAYMAEVIRGGLQAIPKGQYEAARSLGLNYPRMMGLIILPQALRKVVPGIVNTFIGLFKDTTLVLIIGMFDLLGMVQTAGTDPEWLGYSVEGYVFAGLVFWVFCFTMSRISLRFETSSAQERRA